MIVAPQGVQNPAYKSDQTKKLLGCKSAKQFFSFLPSCVSFLSQLRHRATETRLESADKIGIIVKSAFRCNLSDSHIGIFSQLFCIVESEAVQVFFEIYTHSFFEK